MSSIFRYFFKKFSPAQILHLCPLKSERKNPQKLFKKIPPKSEKDVHRKVKGKSRTFRKGGVIMANRNMDAFAERNAELDKEVAEVLIAISVISRQLARKITVRHMSKEAKANGK